MLRQAEVTGDCNLAIAAADFEDLFMVFSKLPVA